MTSPPPVQPDPRPYPPAFAPAPGPPPRQRRTWLIVLISVGVLVLALCGLAGIRLFLNLKHVTDVGKEVNTVTDAFIADSRDGLSQAGYDGLCSRARETFQPQDLAVPPEGQRAAAGHRITSTDVEYARGQATVNVEFRFPDGSTEQEVYILDEEDEKWRMCLFPS